MSTRTSGLNARQPHRQRGIILLLIVLSMLAVAGVVFLAAIGQGAGERAQAQSVDGARLLAVAKQALVGYAVGNLSASGARPGQLPLPDTLTNFNYDGSAETGSCLNAAVAGGLPALSGVLAQVANLRCLGRLPWRTLGLSIDGASERDVLGVVPWYAASQNLSDPNPASACMSVLNPATAAGSTATFSCGVTTGPAWPWLKVCDNTGRLLSDRVAFVLILPGEAIATAGRTQARSIAATGSNPQGYGNPADFLDAIATPAGWAALPVAQRCSTFDNAGLAGEFIAAEKTSLMNDQVMYVTIDELMVELEKRVAFEVREALATVRTNNGGYPWLAPVAIPTLATTVAPDTITTYTSQLATPAGFVPFHDYTNSNHRFLTELSWNIGGPTTGDIGTFTGNLGNPETQFMCGGGVAASCTCRARLATTAAAIPRTLTDPGFLAIKAGTPNVSTPVVACQRSTSGSKSVRDNSLTCDAYTITTTTPVTYAIQRRTNLVFGLPTGNCVTSGVRVFVNDYPGVLTRRITINFTVFSGTASLQAGTSSMHARRSIVNSSVATNTPIIDVTDRWIPDSLGSIPFDQFSATWPIGMLTGSGQTAQTTSVTVSNIRTYPDMPAWYSSQKWNEFIYAAMSADVAPATGGAACGANCLTSGTRDNTDLVVISIGAAFAGQTRYSGSPVATDFLEAPNATGSSTRVFSSSTTARSAAYQDTVVTLPR